MTFNEWKEVSKVSWNAMIRHSSRYFSDNLVKQKRNRSDLSICSTKSSKLSSFLVLSNRKMLYHSHSCSKIRMALPKEELALPRILRLLLKIHKLIKGTWWWTQWCKTKELSPPLLTAKAAISSITQELQVLMAQIIRDPLGERPLLPHHLYWAAYNPKTMDWAWMT